MYNNLTSINSEIVFSTVPLSSKGRKVFQVSPILTIQELDVVRKILVIHNFIKASVSTAKVAAIMDIIADNAVIKNYTALESKVKEILSVSNSHIKK